jgi:Protein of unknown function (DUF3300)
MRATVVIALVLLFACPLSPSLRPAIGPVRAEAAQSDIDTLLAPVALYPDALLAQILMCAGDPGSVRRLDEWLKVQTLKGSELQDEAVLANFEASFVALAVFPQVVRMMAEKLDWTKMLGEVFAADKTAVFASIQRLRAQARQVGTLKSNEQQQVETQTTSSGEQVIVIEPTNPQVVYVPQYNPTVVYTTPPTTVVVQQTSSADAVAAGMIGFTAGIVIGAAVNNSYYYGPYGWHGGGYMYNDAWDDYYDHREDAREDWQDHREDLAEERGDRRENASEQRTERAGERSDRAQSGQQQRTERQENRPATSQQSARSTQAQSAQSGATQQRTQRTSTSNTEARGKTTSTQRATPERSGTKSDAFSGYSSGKSQRAASSRGQSSRGGSRGGGGRRR